MSTETNALKKEVVEYWAERSVDFAALREEEIFHPIAQKWENEIRKYLPEKKPLKILDVGTGAGFFTILLSQMGHLVYGIDLTPEMIEQARMLNHKLGAKGRFKVMDAENLDFDTESFDMVISRNLTWTLPDTKKAYKEWQRVLKKGGILLNFDGNYGKEGLSKKEEHLPENHAHKNISEALTKKNEKIRIQMPVSFHSRPGWDVETLIDLGFENISVDMGSGRRIYDVIDQFYNPTPIFTICAKKED